VFDDSGAHFSIGWVGSLHHNGVMARLARQPASTAEPLTSQTGLVQPPTRPLSNRLPWSGYPRQPDQAFGLPYGATRRLSECYPLSDTTAVEREGLSRPTSSRTPTSTKKGRRWSLLLRLGADLILPPVAPLSAAHVAHQHRDVVATILDQLDAAMNGTAGHPQASRRDSAFPSVHSK